MKKGERASEEMLQKFREGHRRRWEKQPPTAKVQKPDTHGYVRVLLVNHPILGTCIVYQHRLVMVEKLGRPLRTSEQVHHKNGDRTDNNPENLELCSAKEHRRRHPVVMSPERRRNISEAKRRNMTDEVRKRIGDGHRGKKLGPMSEEQKRKISLTMKKRRSENPNWGKST